MGRTEETQNVLKSLLYVNFISCPILKSFIPLPETNKRLGYKLWPFKQEYLFTHCVFQSLTV